MESIAHKRTGVLMVNLGTPDSPQPKDVHRYLTEFLTDGRVLDMPWLKRQLLVRGLIIPRRYKASAKAYQQIWTPEGSPLLVHSTRMQKALQAELGDLYTVELAMRYQNPSIANGLENLLKAGISKLIILPLFPQYASATTGSVHQKVMELLSKRKEIPQVTFIDHYYNHPGLINAFHSAAEKHRIADYDRILFSFHGLPEKQLKVANCHQVCLSNLNCCKEITHTNQNCYAAQCYATARAIAKKMDLHEEQFIVCFQSRLGKEPWLQPYTSQVIAECASRKDKKILVFCPSFVCDCLETIYEIGIEYEAEFQKAGGSSLTLVHSLNDSPAWIQALKQIVLS
jgi:protoporphyrin/coproporphyrin ferrochelatase